MASSSAQADQKGLSEEDYDLIYASKSGWVETRTRCDHLASLSPDLTHIPTPDTPCYRCQHPSQNWLCLSCKDVLCSRFVNKHMLQHSRDTNHSVALGFSDLSVWCSSCDAFLDAQLIPQLRPVSEVAYILKFGNVPISDFDELKKKGYLSWKDAALVADFVSSFPEARLNTSTYPAMFRGFAYSSLASLVGMLKYSPRLKLFGPSYPKVMELLETVGCYPFHGHWLDEITSKLKCIPDAVNEGKIHSLKQLEERLLADCEVAREKVISLEKEVDTARHEWDKLKSKLTDVRQKKESLQRMLVDLSTPLL